MADKVDTSKGQLIAGVMLINGKPTSVWNGDPRVALRLLGSAMEDLREAIFQPRDKSVIEIVQGDSETAARLRNGG